MNKQAYAYSAQEVARLWGVSPHTIWKAIREGNCPIPHQKIGGAIRFPAAEVNKMLGVGGATLAGKRGRGRPRKAE